MLEEQLLQPLHVGAVILHLRDLQLRARLLVLLQLDLSEKQRKRERE
jgi:hypothetical protein